MDSKKTDLPLVVLIGPTNAGKSTLFNRLIGSPQSITAREDSTTRDRIYGSVYSFTSSGVEKADQSFTVADTGGLVDDKSDLYKSIKAQMETAAAEADLILFVYDGRLGLQPRDQQYMDSLRGKKEIWLVANKIDAAQLDQSTKDLGYLGLPTHKISAATGRGVGDLIEKISQHFPKTEPIEPANTDEKPDQIIAIVGRPNMGKSTLLNALTGTDRSVVSSVAGTTRDIVSAEMQINDQKFVLVDTAGVRRRGQVVVGVEKFSVKRSLAAITHASAVIVVVNALEGTTRADLHLIYYANGLKKPVLVIFNKADLLEDRPVRFHHHIAKFDQIIGSALTGDNLDKIRQWISDSAKPKI